LKYIDEISDFNSPINEATNSEIQGKISDIRFKQGELNMKAREIQKKIGETSQKQGAYY